MAITKSLFNTTNQNIFYGGIDKIIKEEGERWDTKYKKMCNVVTKGKEAYVMNFFNGFGFMQRAGDFQLVPTDQKKQMGQRLLVAETFKIAIPIGEDAMEDDLEGIISSFVPITKGVVESEVATREREAANVLNNAFSATTLEGYDGVQLCQTAHAVTTSGASTSNKLATDADFDYGTYQDMLLIMREQTDDRSKPMMLMPKAVVVAPAQEMAANQVIYNQYQPDTTFANNINATQKSFGKVEVIVNPFLTDDDASFILTNDPVGDGFVFFDRLPLKAKPSNEPKEGYEMVIYKSRFAAGFGNWRRIVGTSGLA